jgi:hypothetical protein
MLTPLQMEMLREIKASAGRTTERVRQRREARPVKGRPIGTVSAAAASALRRAADRLDPDPLPNRRPALAVYPGGASGRHDSNTRVR